MSLQPAPHLATQDRREPILALGLMSGTSMDGADAALVEGDGEAAASRGAGASIAYSTAERAALKAAAAEAARAGTRARAEDFASAARIVAERGAAAAEQAIDAAGGARPALVGFHGQTLFHAPEHRFTLQIGDASWLAAALGADVICDFRSADVAAGGQGAPLAPFYHFSLARRAGALDPASGPICFLNLGGVANVTWIAAGAAEPDSAGAMLAFDTGPASALLDDLVAARLGRRYDDDGALAASGVADRARVDRWIVETPFFAAPAPKSIDRDLFNARQGELDGMSDADSAATLLYFTVETIARSVAHMPTTPERWCVSGGGRRNAALMRALAARLGCAVDPVETLGVDGDLLEAEAFAHLAIRRHRGLTISAPGTTGVPRAMTGGVRVTP